MSKILITGGAGFVGYFLAKKLSEAKNNRITILDNLSRGRVDADLQMLLDGNNIDFINGDLTDLQFLLKLDRDFEYIYHLAAIIGVKNITQHPDKALYINTLSNLNMFEYAKNAKGLKKIFFSSSSEVYAGAMKYFAGNVPTNESVPLVIEDITADRTTYALSKMCGELAGFVYGRKYGLPVTIGRYHNVYGPRMGFAHVIPETFIKIHKKTIIDVPSPGHTRAFCFIDDAIEATIRVCENKNTTNELLHIGNPKEEISIKNLVIKISDILGKVISIKELSNTPGSPERRCPDTAKAERLTGYSAKISLDEGIRKTYQWYKDKLDSCEVRIES